MISISLAILIGKSEADLGMDGAPSLILAEIRFKLVSSRDADDNFTPYTQFLSPPRYPSQVYT